MDPRTQKMLAERREQAASAPPPPKGVSGLQAWARANRPAAGFVSAAALVVLFVAYHLAVALPAQRREQEEVEAHARERLRAEAITRQNDMDACLTKAKADTDAKWDDTCKARKAKSGCALPSRLADDYDQFERDARNACLLRFPATLR